MKTRLFSLSTTAFAAVLALNSIVSAQDSSAPTSPQADRGKIERGYGKRHGGGHGMRGLAQLNLTDAQRQQLRAMSENFKNSTGSLREELRQIHSQKRSGAALTAEQEARSNQLREQLKNAMEKQHQDFLAILTPEQRTQMEQFRGQKREGFGEGREGFKRGGHRGGFGEGKRGDFGRGLRGIELSEAQQQQLRTLNEQLMNSTKAQREELMQLHQARRGGTELSAQQQERARQLREALRQSNEQFRANLQNILTPEQRQQIEQRREERKARRGNRQNIQSDSDN